MLGVLTALPAPGNAATWAVYQDETEKCRLDFATNVFKLGKKDAEDFQLFSDQTKISIFVLQVYQMTKA